MKEVKALEIADYLNNWMESKGHIIRFAARKSVGAVVDITVVDDYIDNSIINLKDKFYNELETVLKDNFGITNISYNNTRSCFWKHGQIEIV